MDATPNRCLGCDQALPEPTPATCPACGAATRPPTPPARTTRRTDRRQQHVEDRRQHGPGQEPVEGGDPRIKTPE